MRETQVDKDVIRNTPCQKCGAVPPFDNGERCHAHRIVPGGPYTPSNVIPLCPECHAAEHGDPFVANARRGGLLGTHAQPQSAKVKGGRAGGLLGGPKGARTTNERYPDMARDNFRRAKLRNPNHDSEAGKLGAAKANIANAANGWKAQKENAKMSGHIRWHVKAGRAPIKPCEYCTANLRGIAPL